MSTINIHGKMAFALAGFAIAGMTMTGCVCTNGKCPMADPVIGNWGATLPYESMFAGSFIFTRGEDGAPAATVLHRWGSPEACSDVKIEGNTFSLKHPYGIRIEGEVTRDTLYGRVAPYDKKTGEATGAWKPFKGWRNPPVKCGVCTDEAKFGEKIDLLKDGLAGFKPMGDARNGWSFKDGILSNRVLRDEKGHVKMAHANIMTTRNDFYDFKLEYDVRVPAGANSGVYLRGRYEIQTVDSYGKEPDRHAMAAYYGRVAPKVYAEKKPGEWQHVKVVLFRRHLTVELNGVRIIDNTPVVGVTGGAIDADEFSTGPLYIQGDHTDADYRNMVLTPAL